MWGTRMIMSPASFEYMAEDPCLISGIAVGVIRGIQENDVAACVKHFAANNQETRRADIINVEIDERTFQELYLPGFQAAVQEGKSMAVMGAYNQFRSEYCCQNKHLLRDILRDQWGFDGIVISDWDAVHDTKKAIEAGTDFDMNVDNRYLRHTPQDTLSLPAPPSPPGRPPGSC